MNSIEKEYSDTLSILTSFSTEKILVAFSGGCDSLALLLLTVLAIGKDRTIACYVNHRIREEKELKQEMELNRLNCSKLGVKLVVCDIGEGSVEQIKNIRHGGVEDAARYLRYIQLQKICKQQNCAFILTAHHKDDQCETMLMRLERKSPVVSLRGIPQTRGNIIRPLLEFSKHELEEELKLYNLSYSTDSTNSSTTIQRNRIRLVLIPELQKIMPDWQKRVLEIRAKAINYCNVNVCERFPSLSFLETLNDFQITTVLFEKWDREVGTELPQTLVNRTIDAIRSKKETALSSNGGTFSLYNKRLYVTSNNIEAYKNYQTKLTDCTLPGSLSVLIKDSGTDKDVYIQKDVLRNPIVRFAHQGDTIRLKDCSKMVYKLLQDMKIPPTLRPRVPVLEDCGEILAVFGSVYGARNRVSNSVITVLAPSKHYYYIIIKHNV